MVVFGACEGNLLFSPAFVLQSVCVSLSCDCNHFLSVVSICLFYVNKILTTKVARMKKKPEEIWFIAHSFGCLLTNFHIIHSGTHKTDLPKISKVLMIGPPSPLRAVINNPDLESRFTNSFMQVG